MQIKPPESSENNFLELLNFIVDPAAIVDEKGRILLVNNAFEGVTGLSKNVIGKVFLEMDILTAESKKILLENLKKRMQGLPVQPYEIAFINKNYEHRYVEVKAKKINYAGESADLVLFRDITRRKRNLAKLMEYSERMETLVDEKAREIKEQKEKLEKIFNSSPDAITVVDLNLNIVECNEATATLHGFASKDELIGKSALELLSPKEHKKAPMLLETIWKEGSIKNQEVILTKNGKEFPAEASASVIKNAAGNTIGLVFITKDITERKKIEEKLRASEKHFREALDNMIEGCQIIGYDWRYLYVNDAAAKHGHTTKEKLVGKTMMEAYPGIEKTEVFANLQRCMQKRVEKLMENEFVFPDGRKDWFELRIQPVPEGIFVLSMDITERKQLENSLRTSEEMFRAMNTSAMDAIILLDDTGKITYWNPAAERIFGYTNEEAVGKKIDDLIIPDQHKGFHSKSAMQAFENGQIHDSSIETNALRKNRTKIPIELSVAALEIKDKKHMLGIIRDISERKKMENELKLERDKLEAVTENIGAGLMIISRDYKILWTNDFVKREKGDVEGKQCYAALHSLDTTCASCGAREIFENSAMIDAHEYCFATIDGKPHWVEIIATPIKDKEGTVTAALELVVDITEKKRMQSELANYSKKLEQLVAKRTEQLKQTQVKLLKAEKLAAIGELAGMVGHDLRNPLTGIKGATYYLKTKYAPRIDATGKEMLQNIENAIEHSNKIINDLLEYSNKPSLKLTEITPKALLKNTLVSIKIPKRIQIIDATKDKPKIKADAENMHKVFISIITNAIDAMPETGTLTITSKAEKNNVKITFKDTGTGMTEETLSKLKLGFPLFTTKAKGMGFGLPICKRIVEAHGGKISLKSSFGKGTKVTITIPVNPKPVDTGEEKWIFNESILRAMRIAREAPRKPKGQHRNP